MAARKSKGSAGGAAPPSVSDRSARRAEAVDQHEFLSEAEDILERMFEDLSDLHDQRHAGGAVDPELVNRTFRSAHSLKGLAGMFGLEAIHRLAHHLEDVLDGLRLGRVSLESPAVGLLDEGVGLLASMMAQVASPDGACAEEASLAEAFIQRVEAAVGESAPSDGGDFAKLAIDPAILRALTEYEEHRLRDNLSQGRTLVVLDVTFTMDSFAEDLGHLSEEARAHGELISTLPSPGAAPESEIRFSILMASDLTGPALAERLSLPLESVLGLGETEGEPSQRAPGRDEAAVGEDRAAAEPASEAPDETGAVPAFEPMRSRSETVRVDIRKLDELMNLVGELGIQSAAIEALGRRLASTPTTARVGRELQKSQVALARKLTELQAGVLDVRMVPLRQIFDKLSRVAKRLQRDLGKRVELEFGGADTELDKFLVEQLVDPLLHIVRNAFDHAIEPDSERKAAGKPLHGRIAVRAVQRGNHVVIEVEDDGRGLSVERIRAKAVAQGLLAETDTPSRREILSMVFTPGFSTRDEVSETSGRGVGMDVVRSNLSDLGGSVELASEEGVGTTVSITVPITLAILQVLLVRVGAERFAIPLGPVRETIPVEPDRVGRSENRELLELRGEPLFLKRLGVEFEIDCAGPEERQFAVVVSIGGRRLGLLVDELEGQRDAIIKPIQGPIQQIPGIAGATEVGDAGAILVLDVASLFEDSSPRREAA